MRPAQAFRIRTGSTTAGIIGAPSLPVQLHNVAVREDVLAAHTLPFELGRAPEQGVLELLLPYLVDGRGRLLYGAALREHQRVLKVRLCARRRSVYPDHPQGA